MKSCTSNTEPVTEAELQLQSPAPRVTSADVEAIIVAEHTFTAGAACRAFGHPALDALDILTICVLVLRNGFTIVGASKPVSADNFDREIGRRLAREDAVEQIWPYEGYLLQQRLHENLQKMMAAPPSPHVVRVEGLNESAT